MDAFEKKLASSFDPSRFTGTYWEADDDLRKLVTGPWSTSAEGCQRVAVLLLSLWQLSGLRGFGLAPPFLMVHQESETARNRNWLWFTLERYRRELTAEALDRVVMKSRARTRRSLRYFVRNGAGNGTKENSYESLERYFKRLSQPVPLQRFMTMFDPDLGVAVPAEGMVSLWVGSDSQVDHLARILSEGAFVEKILFRTRPLITPNAGVPGAVMGGVSMDAWSKSLTPVVFGKGRPMLGLGMAFSEGTPPKLDLRVDIRMFSRTIQFLAGSKPHSMRKGYLKFEGHVETYARLVQRRMPMVHPEYLLALLTAMRELKFVAESVAEGMIANEDARDGLAERLVVCGCRGLAIGALALLPEIWAVSPEPWERSLAEIVGLARDSGSISRRDILRKLQPMKSGNRDKKLEYLASMGLVGLVDHQVVSVPMNMWADRLPGIFDFPTIGPDL